MHATPGVMKSLRSSAERIALIVGWKSLGRAFQISTVPKCINFDTEDIRRRESRPLAV